MENYLITFIALWVIFVVVFVILILRIFFSLRIFSVESQMSLSGKIPEPSDNRRLGSSMEIALQEPLQPKYVSLARPICRAVCFHTSIHEEGGEDRIVSDVLGNSWPFVIVADGVSIQEDVATGQSVTGTGGLAAEQAVIEAEQYLKTKLPDLESLEDVLRCLGQMYDAIAQSLRYRGTPGATTLLLGLLWGSKPRDDALFWCYAYEGDGFIILLSPKQKIEGVVIPQKMLSPQKVESTACISKAGITVSPVVGCLPCKTGDLIYVASDGIAPADSWLRKEHNVTFSRFILSHLHQPETLEETLRLCPNYTDDAVIGFIWVETNDVGANY
jgi:hypothetical protein